VGGLDYEAVAVFARLGFFVGDATPWTGYRAVAPPGMNDAARSSIWDEPEPVEPIHGRSRSELVATYVDLFRQAIARLPHVEPLALGLSGGADSRHILLELVRQGRGPRVLLTVERSPADQDPPVARALAEHFSIPHRTIRARQSYRDELEKNRATSFLTDEHSWVAAYGAALAHETRESFDGLGGDVLSAGPWLWPHRLEHLDDAEYIAESLMWPEEAVRASLAPQFYELVPRDLAKTAVIAEYERWRDEANPIGAFYFRNAMRRETTLQPFGLLHPIAMHTPFLDPELVSFLRSIPAEELVGRTFHREAIRTGYPEAAHIPFDKDRKASVPRRVAQKLYQRAKALQLVLRATESPRLSRQGALRTIGKRRYPMMFAKRMAWIAELPESPPSAASAARYITPIEALRGGVDR
jgi:asparagine synthase (glutamine-hydrolysing)